MQNVYIEREEIGISENNIMDLGTTLSAKIFLVCNAKYINLKDNIMQNVAL